MRTERCISLLAAAFLLSCVIPEDNPKTDNSWGFCPEPWVGSRDTSYLSNKWLPFGICPQCPTCGQCVYNGLYVKKLSSYPGDNTMEIYGGCMGSGDTCREIGEERYSMVDGNPYRWVRDRITDTLNITLLSQDSFAYEVKHFDGSNGGCIISTRTTKTFIDSSGNAF